MAPLLLLFQRKASAGTTPKSVLGSGRSLLAGFGLGLLLAVSAPGFAVTHATTHKSKTHTVAVAKSAVPDSSSTTHWRPTNWYTMFPGSHEMLVQQNQELDRQQLPRFFNDTELMQYELSQDLVPVQESEALKLAENLPENRRYCRPWTRDFLQDFSTAFYDQFHVPLQVNSLVRTVEQQMQLRRHNRFAAPEIGDTASTHLTGVTFDLSRRGLNQQQYEWIRNYMLPLKANGMIDPIEESQPVLHVVVFQQYSAGKEKPKPVEVPVKSWSEASEPNEVTLLSGAGAQ